jgi:hypothetical protein
MSKYTTMLRWILTDSNDYMNIPDADFTRLKLDQYPIFDENHRRTLNELIINTYFYEEIGFETVGMFIQRLHARMLSIMPKFNYLYELATMNTLTELRNIGVVTLSKSELVQMASTNSGTNQMTENTSNTGSGNLITSNPPQSGFTMSDLTGLVYANSADINSDQSTGATTGSESSTGAANSNQTVTKTEDVYTGNSKLDIIEKMKGLYLDIDNDIVKNLANLFMLVY